MIALLCALLLAQAPAPAGPPVVGEIAFEGADAESVRSLVEVCIGQPLETRDVRDAVRALHASAKFSRVAAYAEPAPDALPVSILHFVWRTGETVVVADASTDQRFSRDAYVAKASPRSVLCVPVRTRAETTGLLYLENNVLPGAFTRRRLTVLEALSAQVAISLENARLLERERCARAAAEEAHRQVEQAVRLRDEFLAVASHELKTTTTALLARSQLARSRLRRGKVLERQQIADLVDVIEWESQRLNMLTARLLDTSRIQAGTFALECEVADCQHFIKQQNIRIEMSCHRECQAHIHATGKFLHRGVHEARDLGKIHDGIVLASNLCPAHAENSAI